MNKYVYLTCTPEAFVASMLPPEGFGLYLSTGFYAGAKDEIIFYPYPMMSELENMDYEFFREI